MVGWYKMAACYKMAQQSTAEQICLIRKPRILLLQISQGYKIAACYKMAQQSTTEKNLPDYESWKSTPLKSDSSLIAARIGKSRK
jgi:hypothetical protein